MLSSIEVVRFALHAGMLPSFFIGHAFFFGVLVVAPGPNLGRISLTDGQRPSSSEILR